MSKKIYVGNLSFQTTEETLRNLFAQHGEVLSATVVTDRDTGRSRGFGFVEMDDASAADAAMRALDGTDLGGRNLKVNEAQDKRGGGGGGGGGRRYSAAVRSAFRDGRDLLPSPYPPHPIFSLGCSPEDGPWAVLCPTHRYPRLSRATWVFGHAS